MDETYNLNAIILKRQPFREADSRICLFSRERGKLDLVARGTQKFSSKLASHIEPLNISRIMAVKGKQYDYVGGADSDNCFFNIKSDFEKLDYSGRALSVFNKLVKEEEKEGCQALFYLIKDYLEIINKSNNSDYELLLNYFILKLLSELGYKPEFYNCLECNKKILINDNYYFNYSRGGLICKTCNDGNDKDILTISNECTKVLRLVIIKEYNYLRKLKLSDYTKFEIFKVVKNFYNFILP